MHTRYARAFKTLTHISQLGHAKAPDTHAWYKCIIHVVPPLHTSTRETTHTHTRSTHRVMRDVLAHTHTHNNNTCADNVRVDKLHTWRTPAVCNTAQIYSEYGVSMRAVFRTGGLSQRRHHATPQPVRLILVHHPCVCTQCVCLQRERFTRMVCAKKYIAHLSHSRVFRAEKSSLLLLQCVGTPNTEDRCWYSFRFTGSDWVKQFKCINAKRTYFFRVTADF